METSQNLGLYAFLLPFCSFMATATVERSNGVFSRTITAKQLMDLCRLIREIKLGIRLQPISGEKSMISIAITSGKYNAQTTRIIPRVA
jgi:hypothetical protein